jgi:hypothetical protein
MRLVHFPSARLSSKRDEDIVHATSMVNLWSLVPETTSGGNAIPFYASVRLRVSSKPSSDTEGALTMKVKVVKNKVAPALNKEAVFEFIAGKGTETYSDLVSYAKDIGLLRFAGSSVKWFNPETGEEETLCSGGKAGAVAYFKEHVDQYQTFKSLCLSKSTGTIKDDSSSDSENVSDD